MIFNFSNVATIQNVKHSAHQLNRNKAQKTQKFDGCDSLGWEHFKSQLIACRKCRRTFFPHRLSVHEKACKGLTLVGIRSKDDKSLASNTKICDTSKTTLSDNCKNCKKKFSTTSIALHELKCKR